MSKPETIVPVQRKGGRSFTSHSIKLHREEEAKKWFTHCRMNLLNVNKWHDLAGPLSAKFQLTDRQGSPVEGPAREGNYFKIEMPAIPGNPEGKGYDWVRVERIEEEKNDNFEWTAIRVRPAQPPVKDNSTATAHFFTHEASSSFCVERRFNRVTASVFGRNEKANVKTGNFFSVIRNAIIALAAIFGMSKSQWKNLMKGIVSK